jgi:hypothetical protein
MLLLCSGLKFDIDRGFADRIKAGFFGFYFSENKGFYSPIVG